MTDDALDEIRRLRLRLAAIERAAGLIEPPKVWSTRDLSDRDTYTRNREDIHRALSEPGTPRIVEAEPIERPTPTYPPSEIPGWTPVGRDMYEAPAPAPKSKGQEP
jgi:hypothetical protein